MTRNDALSRFSSITSSSTDSARSTATIKPLPSTPTSTDSRRHSSSLRRAIPSRLKTDDDASRSNSTESPKDDPQISPTTTFGMRVAISPSSPQHPNVTVREHRLSDFGNYRRDLAGLDPAGGRVPHIQQTPPNSLPSLNSQIAPWMASNGVASTAPGGGSTAINTTFYNDSSDNLSIASQLSPGFRPPGGRPSISQPSGVGDISEPSYFDDERRPSLASITTTASSQGSKASGNRGGFRKLQGFFGEEFPGRDSSDVSLPPAAAGKEHRSHSYSHGHPYRDRNYSNATDHTRDASPSSSRPRTPVPAPEVVPFLYQEVDDIAKYGEAPVRDILSGPDRERYVTGDSLQNPPKTSSSSRSGHSLAHLSGHHRHQKSNDDPRALRPTVSREEAAASSTYKDHSGSSNMASSARDRAHSPAPSGNSIGGYFGGGSKNGNYDGQTSPPGHPKKSLLGRFKRSKEKEDGSLLRNASPSTTSLVSKHSRSEFGRSDGTSNLAQEWVGRAPEPTAQENTHSKMGQSRHGPFKSPFTKKTRAHYRHDDRDEAIGPTDKQEGTHGAGTMFHLDTDLNDMSGILSRPLPLTPMDADFVNNIKGDKSKATQNGRNGAWDAPDSWAVKRTGDDSAYHAPENEDMGPPPKPEEKMTAYCIRVFKSDGTFATLQMPIDSSVQDLIGQLSKKAYLSGGLEYHIALRKHNLIRVLGSVEKPLFIQKRLLQQVGFEERDRIEDIGREDNSYLCRFLFMSSRELEQQARTQDLGLGRTQKFNHVDLSARNIIRIPIYLYSKVQDIISLNLSKNLSLDLPRDFISSCQNLRDIKFNNNEARQLPASLGRASRLTYLDVSNNRISHLESAELNGLVGLLKLNLANNRLKHLPPYFGAYRSLRTLNVSSNFLDKFPSFLCELESLVDLDMSFNLIGSFPPAIENLRNLEKLVITNNRLGGTLPETFSRLQNLRELDIKYNAISGIDAISLLPKLEILTADHNAISQFVGSFERIRSLKLKDNPITRFELTAPVPTLKLLNLSNAKLASIAESFNHMLNLERLVLDRNHFVSLPGQIGRLRRLEHFSIAHNALAELPPEIGCLQELKFLDVRGNNLKKLPLEIWWANKLETLNASSNVMTDFPKPASRPPQAPPDTSPGSSSQSTNGKVTISHTLSAKPSLEDLEPDESRRPSQTSSSTLLSVGPSPVPAGPDRKSSVVSVYGKGGRKTSIISRSANSSGSMPTPPTTRKDSGLSARITNTFSGSLRNLYLADNLLDDDVFDQIMLLCELRTLNLSFNQISDMPQRCIKSWPQLSELYLSGNELTTLPVDDLEEYSLLQVLHINSNKFTNLPADISRAKKLAVLDCGSNYLKYNISNVPYDWNWNLNPNLRYLNLSGNRRLEIKQAAYSSGAANREQYTDFSRLQNLRVLGLMDVTLTLPSIPDQSEDRRVRTSGSLAGYLPYAMADTLGKNEHLSTIDLVVPRFNASDTETLLGLFDGQALSTGGSKIAKYLHEHFGRILSTELKALKSQLNETAEDALRRAFLSLNKELVTIAIQHGDDRATVPHRSGSNSHAPIILNKEDINAGAVATVVYLQGQELYVANVGDAQAMIIHSDGTHKMLTRKHDPAEPTERSRIREAGGWVSRNGKLNDQLVVSRAFGFADLMPAVQAAPHVSHVTIREQDEMILLATSDLWEHLAPELVVDIARQERVDLMRATQKLRDLAIAYGSTNKIMIMMISVADLKRRTERTRFNRGQSMSIRDLGLQGDQYKFPTRGRRKKDPVMDSTLQRLEAEVPAPTGMIAIVFTDIKNSTNLWETYPAAMRSAIKLHNEMMRRQLRRIGGFEVKTEGDAFMVSFPTATSALLWCFAVQLQLLEVNWPSEMLNSVSCQPVVDKNNQLIFKGLSVRMGIHWGAPHCEPDPITRRMDYYGPMVNKASRISAVADGGQITVSSDFISEIQRCLETYQESSATADESLEDDQYSLAIRKELRSLSSQGFEVKELGERKLKGLENPEVVYSLYPHQLAGRIETHQAHDRGVAAASNDVGGQTPAVLKEGSELEFDPEAIWMLWKVSLRLEMLCSSLEYVGGRGLQPPETQLLERMKQRGGEVTEDFLVNFMEHQISRIETCISTLSIRHLAIGGGMIKELDDLRGPVANVLANIGKQMAELQRYKELYGPLEETEGDQGPSSRVDEL